MKIFDMMLLSKTLRLTLLASAASALPISWASAAVPVQIVFQNGRSAPLSAVALQGANLVITGEAEGYSAGQSFPFSSADHVYGDKPPGLNPGVALLLMDKAADALKLLEPIVESQRVSAKIPGNFWIEAARAALVAYAVTGNSAKCNEIGKEISEATPAQGADPFIALGKALLLPSATKFDDRNVALRDLTTDNLPADVCAYASFYRGNFCKAAKRDAEALEAYLMVPCLFPSGGMILNAVAELNASEFLTTLGRREEAVALLTSAIHHSPDTIVLVEAGKRLESLK